MSASAQAPWDATAPLAPGPLLTIAGGRLEVAVAPSAGGRIAQIRHEGEEQLLAHADAPAAIAWGCYPMLPWAGRIRNGRFDFAGRAHQLACNLGPHAIHGVGFALPWRVERHAPHQLEMSLDLPQDARWPFGGVAHQRIEVAGNCLRLGLSVTAGPHAMPVTLGWHPWFLKPERLDFRPHAMYPRDAEGISTLPLTPPTPGPWDDCFLNEEVVVLHRGGRILRLRSDCKHWVVFDGRAEATCVEPQTGPPDGPNLAPRILAPGATLSAWYLMEWGEARQEGEGRGVREEE